jgi:hypothetical protein
MPARHRPMDAEAADIRGRIWALLGRHAKGCPGCSRYMRDPHISYTCDAGWELGKALVNMEHAQQELTTELEAPDPRLQPLW